MLGIQLGSGVVTETEEQLRGLEESLWESAARFDPTHMEQVLHPDFLEFGRSGRTYTRSECLAMERTEILAELRDFVVHPVDHDTVLVTYVSVVRGATPQVSNRSSLWLRKDGRWLLRFHQGTPVPE